MRRFAIPFLLLFILMALTIKQSTLRTAVALFDHPTLKVSMVNSTPVRTFHFMTPFEREVRARSLWGYHVPSVSKPLTVDLTWVSPREGKVVIDKATGRWHRGQSWRRMS